MIGWGCAKWHHHSHRLQAVADRLPHGITTATEITTHAVVYRAPHGITTATENHMTTYTNKGKNEKRKGHSLTLCLHHTRDRVIA